MPEATALAYQRGAAEAGSRDAGSGREPVDLLVVDDRPGNLVALETALAPLGTNIVFAGSGREALRHLLNREFATVILDVNMPDLDGFETAQMIRSRPRSAATPIIFVSAVNVEESDAYRGYSLGAVDYICGPIVPEVLRAKVAVFVELHRKTEEARMHAKRLQERTLALEKSQQELRLSERMAAIGTLCAGLGHDMGNLLLPINVWVDSIRPSELPNDLQEGVQGLRTCIQYLRRLAAGLRLVSLDPSQEISDSRVLLADWIEEFAPILRNALPRGIQLEINIERDIPPVRIAPHRLAQAVFNLVQNAGEALRGRKDGLVRLWALLEETSQGVRIGVTDNGSGMSRETLERCLDPFFTTKARGISTGLGLSLVHGIVQNAGSTLDADSSPQRGTTFSFVLSLAEALQPQTTPATVTISDARTRAIVVALLRAAGFDVVARLPDGCEGPAIWVTDGNENIDQLVHGFMAANAEREVFLLADGEHDCTRTVSLTGQHGLAAELQRFVRRLRRSECG